MGGRAGRLSIMKPRILLVGDEPGWAFDRNLRDLARYLSDEFDFDHWHVVRQGPPLVDRRERARYAGAYAAYRWDLGPDFPYRRSVGSLRCQYFDPACPGPATFRDLSSALAWGAFHTTTREAWEELRGVSREMHQLMPDDFDPHAADRLAYLTNPVDAPRFAAVAPPRDHVVASWAGNAMHSNARGVRVKGLAEIVQPACARAGVPLIMAEYWTCRVSPEDMPAFYGNGNVTVCASLYEGASNAVMEAMASGHAVVATDVGNHREMAESEVAHFGASGIVMVERSVESVAAALSALTPGRVAEMGAINRAEIAARWSWAAWCDRYAAVLRRAIGA